MRYDEIGNYLFFGKNLSDLKAIMQEVQYGNVAEKEKIEQEKDVKMNFTSYFELPQMEYPRIQSFTSIPDIFSMKIERYKSKEIAKIVELGFYVDNWWQSQYEGKIDIEEHEEKIGMILNDLNQTYPGFQDAINNVIGKFSEKRYDDIYRSELLMQIKMEILKAKKTKDAPVVDKIKIQYDPNKILFLGASPDDQVRLNLGREVDGIKKRLRRGGKYSEFVFEYEFSTTSDDFVELLQDFKPAILHFTGHGTTKGEIIFEKDSKMGHKVKKDALVNLISKYNETVLLVVLNACHSKTIADEIGNHIDCVIGMSKRIEESVSISFSKNFYFFLSYGDSLQEAFDKTISAMVIDYPSIEDTVELIDKKNIANKLFFVKK